MQSLKDLQEVSQDLSPQFLLKTGSLNTEHVTIIIVRRKNNEERELNKGARKVTRKSSITIQSTESKSQRITTK